MVGYYLQGLDYGSYVSPSFKSSNEVFRPIQIQECSYKRCNFKREEPAPVPFSKVDTFPKARLDCLAGPQLPKYQSEMVSAANLPSRTLNDSTNERFNISTYFDNYKDEKPEEPIVRKLIQGKCPCWPGSDSKIVSKSLGRNVEKRDKVSRDDDDDQRILKLFPEKIPEKPKEYQYSNKPMAARTDLVPLSNFYLCGVGPYFTGVPNSRKHLETTAFREKVVEVERAKQAKEAWAEDEESEQRYEKSRDDPTTARFERQYASPEFTSQNWKKFQENLTSNWQSINNPNRRNFPQSTGPGTSPPYNNYNESAGNNLNIEDIEMEEKRPIKNPPNPSLWSLNCKRKEGKLVNMMKSAAPIEKQFEENLNKMKEKRLQTAAKIEKRTKEKDEYMITGNPDCLFFSPKIKLQPTSLWDAQQIYTLSGSPIGSQYKTLAWKRYHMTHPEPERDLRDWLPKFKKDMFLGYHASAFR